MSRFAEALHAIAVTVWAGSLWTIGLLVLPLLIATPVAHDALLAAQGRLLSVGAMLALACGAYLLLFRLWRFRTQALRQSMFWTALAMLLLVLARHYFPSDLLHALRGQDLAHRMLGAALRERVATWFGLPSAVYLLECALALPLVLLQQGAAR